MNIPTFMDRDDYLQNPIMHRFLKDHRLDLVHNRADYINTIEEYANKNKENEGEVIRWLEKIAKEGSKEICYRKIYGVEEWHRIFQNVEKRINEIFPNCPKKSIANYRNTKDQTLINYNIVTNENGEVNKIEFVFSKLYFYGITNTYGNTTCYPIYIDVYLKEGFVVSRAKAKSTLFAYDETNNYLNAESKINTMEIAIDLIDDIIEMFGFETELNKERVKHENSSMLFNIYEKYSFTPSDVIIQVNSQKNLVKKFIDEMFSNLSLDVRNKEKAILDAEILVEKFISINGDNEETFKKDRPAYLIKITSDDDIELTKIDTSSDKTVPLQCTEIFFDSKKSVLKSQKCKKLHLIFKRENEQIFSKNNPLIVQFGTHKNHGYVKTMQYAEEADIQNVLQTIFDNY